MIKNPRNLELTDDQKEALERVIAVANRKSFYADLVANCYNNAFPADFWSCAAYLRGEPDQVLKKGLLLMLELSTLGIESHEYFGEEVVRGIIDKWNLEAREI